MIKLHSNWRKSIILFFFSQCVTLLGSQIVQMGVVWYVTLQTDSGAWVAIFSVCSYLPQFFVSFIGGAWADRCNRKYLIIVADAMIAVVTFVTMQIIPYITTDAGFLAALLLMSLIRSACAGVQSPAVNAVIPQLVPEEYLSRYNGIYAAMQSFVQFCAPAAAAVVLTISTVRSTFLIDIVTAVVGIAVLSGILIPKQEKMLRIKSVLAEVKVGVRYVHTCVVVRKALFVYGLFVFLTVPAGYLSGLLVSRVFGDTYWYLTAVELVGFGGMMLGGLLMSFWGGFRNRSLTLQAGLGLFGVMAISMAISHNFTFYLISMALYGVALTTVQTTITTILQESAEHSMQGRVFGLMSSLYASFYPMGMVLFGPLADIISIHDIMVFSGVVLIIVALQAAPIKN